MSDGTHSATYSYVANSPLVEQIQFTNGSLVMTTTKEHDYLNRLTAIESSSSSFSSSSSYQYNNANQRTSVTNADGSYWVYEYDALGQVTSGKKRRSDGSLVAGQQFEYGFDDIGNRETSASGGNNSGTDLRSVSYGANLLNQYTSRTVPPQVSVTGEADADATVTVNLQSTVRKGDYWWGEAVAANSAGPVWLAITNIAVLDDSPDPDIVATNVGHARVPKASESFIHDADGNLTSDSLWVNTWNAENRRTVVESSAAVPAAGRAREQWTFLPDGRWIERIVSTNNGSGYYPAWTNRYVWDGNVLLAVLNRTNGVELAFMRGLDLSGSHQGAGGVGGLLAVKVGPAGLSGPLANTTHFACFDGNGNVMALVNASTGAESARYEYGPFGEDIRATGPMAQINPMRFSTQYADDVTGDRKYLFRDYRIFLGRWLNRDPLEEQGGVNLYGFLANRGVSLTDTFGLGPFSLYVRKIEDSLAAGEEENAAFEAWKLYIAIGRNQEVLIPVPVAARFINRWLDKVGGTAPLSPSEVEELMNERTVRTMIANEVIARGYAGSGSVTSLRFRDLTATSKTDYFYALGWFQASFSGTYSVSASNGSVVLDGCFRMWDRYDWQNPGNKSVVLPPPPYPNGDVIYDRYATLVEDHGYATPFRVTGAANLRVEAEPGPLPRPR